MFRLLSRLIAVLLAACISINVLSINAAAEMSVGTSIEETVSSQGEGFVLAEEQSDETISSAAITESEVEKTNGEENTSEIAEPTQLSVTDEPSWLSVSSNKVSCDYSSFSAKYFANILKEYGGYSDEEILTLIQEDVQEDGLKVTVKVAEKQENILSLLSRTKQGNVTFDGNTKDFNYSNWTIKCFEDRTGNISLPTEFEGLGDERYPFAGTLYGQGVTFVIEKTLFKSLDAAAELNGMYSKSIRWKGTADQAILADVLYVDGQDRTLDMPLVGSSAFSPYIGEIKAKSGIDNPGIITFPDLNFTPENNENIDHSSFDGNAGLLCGTMSENTKVTLSGKFILPENTITVSGTGDVGAFVGKMENGSHLILSSDTILINTLSGYNVGGLVGSMGDNSVLTISEPITLTNQITVSNNAGGLVGTMGRGSKIDLNAKVTIAKAGTESEPVTNQITATNSAGGIVGELTTVTGAIDVQGENVISLNDTGSEIKGAINAGGLYGSCTASGNLNPFTGVTITDQIVTVGGAGSCGGVFGTLNLDGENNKCVIDKTIIAKLCLVGEGKQTLFGGIVGTLFGSSAKNALVIHNEAPISDSTTPHVTTNIKYGEKVLKPQFLGGIVAYQKATLDVKNVCVKLAEASQTIGETEYFTGGLSAKVADGQLLLADNIKIIVNGYSAEDHNGGIAGNTGKGSVVYLKNNILLKDCPLQSIATCGQIVATQDCSLIYGPNVKFTRWGQGMEVDDIGNYGELYCVRDFIEVAENYTVTFSPSLEYDNEQDTYILNDEIDYACLALAWQSRGVFTTVTGISSGNWNTLRSSKIKLGKDIDLTNKGIGGLSRDAYSADDTFTGTLNGNGRTLTLDIGSKKSENNATSGDGKIYFHNSTGLFAGLSSRACVSNLTINGNVRVSNNRLVVDTNNEINNMKTGALAGVLLCEDNSGNITKVSTDINIAANSNTQTINAPFYIGGLFGLAYGSSDYHLKLDGNLDANISHDLSENSSNPIIGQCFHTGGAIGAVDSTCTNLKVDCDQVVVSGKIERTGTAAENYYAGGLIGTIFPSDNSTRAINLTNIKVGQKENESISANPFIISGDAELRMGGVLGGIWADTDVIVSGLTVENATINTSGTAKLGGLVYRASGKWEVSKANLSGLAINAQNAKALGLMVCQGGAYKEPLSYKKTPADSVDTYKEIGGLYLVLIKDWNTAYSVSKNITFNENGDAFDEFVAYTASAYFTEGNKNSPAYSITSNNCGIISLKTDNGKVNMTNDTRNTYENRTDVSKKSNLYSRYYYNLPDVKTHVESSDNSLIDTPQDLLIWSVYHYAASNLENYFRFNNVEKFEIGGTAKQPANFDMDELSYYPIRIVNSNFTVQYANVILYNNNIENKVSEEKSTRGDNSVHSQHYMMHCGLFYDYAAENIVSSDTYIMTVNAVKFSGTVGKINGQSGALICGSVYGDKENSNTATCTVVLADGDDSSKAITLDGIVVDSTDIYRPVLIGYIDSYAGLKANYINSSNNQSTAGSSLIGTVGSQNAVGISIAFAGTIKLPDKSNVVFTRATLLESIQYQSGSTATYRFGKAKDWGENSKHIKDITYGYEISESVEFNEEKGCYYDGFGEQYYISDSGDFSKLNSFTAYLPYVAYSPSNGADINQGWHELEVNILAPDLDDGCGTYGHPYHVNAKQLKYVAIYLNNPSDAPNNWKIKYKSVDNYHNSGTDIELVFNGTDWTGGSRNYTLDEIQEYLNNAYYVIDRNITLQNFPGLGTASKPFRGVITGNDPDTNIEVFLKGTTPAFIYYSYGAVVRDLNISLEQSLSLLSSAPGVDSSGNRKAEGAPDNFYGGVIGNVMGGDNIIDNVSVLVPDSEQSLSYTFEGGNSDYQHLVPVGGYVGVVAGGGVIFRRSISDGLINDDTAKDSNYLYRNPIVGRVLNGYAFYEGDDEAPDNTDKNYKINTISRGNHLSWNDGTITINDSEGLLLLSAIVSSGAGSYKKSLAYNNGVSRVAQYDKIGKDENEANSDYQLSMNASIPYLLSANFNEGTISPICQNCDQSGVTLILGDNLDVGEYRNGFRGISARYVSNAGFTNTTEVSPYTVVLRLKCFDGNNKTISGIDMNVKEYDDDDFHIASMGGVINIAWTNLDTGGGSSNNSNNSINYDSVLAKNLTISNCTVKLQYIDKDGGDARQAQTSYFTQTDGISTVAAGGFIGTVNNLNKTAMNSVNSNYLFENIRLDVTASKRNTIYGPNSAGGIIGASGMGSNGYPSMLLTNGMNAGKVMFSPSFLNCAYCYTDITGYLAAGGLVGCSATGYSDLTSFGTTQSGFDQGAYATCTMTDDMIFADHSTVKTLSSGGICGGIFGGIGMRGLINDSEVNSKTGLSIIGENASVNLLSFKEVDFMADLFFDSHITYTTGRTVNGVDNGKTIAVGGCIGRISHANPVRINKVQFGDKNDSEKRNYVKIGRSSQTVPSSPYGVSDKYAGGLVGYGFTNEKMIIQDCSLYNTNVSGDTASGLVSIAKLNTLQVSNCIIQDCSVDCSTRAGGIAGNSEGSVNLINILLKDTSITKNGEKNQTNVARLVVQTSSKTINAAGISVFAKDSSISLPDKDIFGSYIGYVAYADYLAETTNHEKPKEPYVTVNPCYQLQLTDGTKKELYGDAVKYSEVDGSIAGQIFKENKEQQNSTSIKGNYANYSGFSEKITKPNVISLNSAIGEGPSDLPVLLVKGGDSKSITDYLDIITNGGSSAASKVDKVEFKTTAYYLNQEQTAFSTETWDTDHDGAQSVTTSADGKKLIVSGTSYDNTRHRFSLVEATFKTDLGDYTVSIPVVVQRKLEYVYMATLSYGTEFNADTYQNIRNHLLESTGVPFSGYLTVQYNKSYNNGKLEDTEYDWKSFIEGGGNLVSMDKTLDFSTPLPVGTQFTLLDSQHGNQAYYYCNEKDGIKSISLRNFRKTLSDESTAFAFSMADILGITREEEPTPNGLFLKLPDSDGATVLLNGEYFRRAEEGETGKRYNFVYPADLSTKQAEENYYLVITVPHQGESFAMNGTMRLGLNDNSYSIPTNGTKVRRNMQNSIDEDKEESTESTYNISSGYQQDLKTRDAQNPTNLNDANNKMHMEMTDTISFPLTQAYGDNDSLFLKFTVSLLQTKEDQTSDRGIPAGTTGTVLFYVQDSAGNYYKRSGSDWIKSVTNEEKDNHVCSYDWESDGGNLSLILSKDGTPLDLAGVRKLIKDNSGVEAKIIVRAVMKEDIAPVYSGEDDVIPNSKDGLDNYAKVHYVAQLSTQARSLNYSTVRAITNDDTHYFRYLSYQAVLSMDAANIDQLGINPLQLVEDYQTVKNNKDSSIVDLNASLDLSNLQNADEILQNANSITFRLSLQRRKENGYENVADPSEYITFDSFEYDESNKNWTRTIEKNSEDWSLILSGSKFAIAIRSYVFTDPRDFANYKIVLDASISDATGNNLLTDEIKNANDANIIFTYACIKPTFYTFPSNN